MTWTALMSLSAVLLFPRQAAAQDVGYDYVNAGTIKHGGDVFYDVDPFDAEKGYGNIAKGTCSLAGGVQNVVVERIVADGYPSAFGTHIFVDPNDKTGSGAFKCTLKSERISIGNVAASRLLFYRVGDTVYTYNNQVSFVKTNTINDAEIFTRSGEQTDICPDIVVRQAAGQWLIFPMAGKDDDSASSAKSEIYQDSFGFADTLNKCRVAPYELATQFKVSAIVPDYSPENNGCGPNGNEACSPGALILAPHYATIGGDDGYIIVNGVGGVENAPPSNSPPPGQAGSGEFVEEQSACTVSFGVVNTLTLKWLFCGIINMMMSGIELLEDFITNLLEFDTSPLEPKSPYHKVWASFRALALGIIVIVALVMVIAQATGVEAFSAYTVRSVLARLGVAVLFIVVSFSLLKELMEIVNGIMIGLRSLVYAPFNGLPHRELTDGAYGMSLLLGTGALAIFGPFALLSFVGTALLSVALTSAIIIMAHSLLYILIMVSPIAIALAVLPNTRSAFQFLQNAFTSIVFGLIAVSFVMAAMRVISVSTANLDTTSSANQLIALAERAAIPFVAAAIFMKIGGAIGAITGGAKGVFQRGFGALSNFRGRKAKELHQGRMSGQTKLFGSNALGGAYRRAGNAKDGGLSFTARGRAKYSAARQKQLMNVTDQMLEQDKGMAANDDDSNALAEQAGMTRSQFVDNLMARTPGSTRQQAENRLAILEQSYGAKIGTDAMRLAAGRARMASNTGYQPVAGDPNAHYAQWTEDAARLISDGLLTHEAAATALKQNKARPDISGIGFTDIRNHLVQATGRLEAGATGEGLLGTDQDEQNATVAGLKQSALVGSAPGIIAGGRHEAVDALAPQMFADLQNDITNGDDNVVAKRLAQIAGVYDTMGQISPASAGFMDQHVMSQTVPDLTADDGSTTTVQQLIENFGRTHSGFTERRREYGSATAAQAALAGGQPPGGGPQAGPPPVVPPNGSDRRFKSNIHFTGEYHMGIKLYRFQYFWDEQVYVGVIAQELLATHAEAVITDKFGYYYVDYAALGTRMYTLEEWQGIHPSKGTVSRMQQSNTRT